MSGPSTAAVAVGAACAVSLILAPWRGTPLERAGDVVLVLIVAGVVACATMRSSARRRWHGALALAITGTIVQLAVPFAGWGRAPMLGPMLSMAPLGQLALGWAAGVGLRRVAAVSARREAVGLVGVALVATVTWSLVEISRVRQLRQGAVSVTVRTLRALEARARHGSPPRELPRDGWGWRVRIEQGPVGARIAAPCAGGRFDRLRDPGAVASWEDDLVLSRDQVWVRWPPGANGPIGGQHDPWLGWRSRRCASR